MFGEKLKELRKGKNITQTEFAAEMQVTKGAVGMWETNKRTPDIDTLKRIAQYFGISVDELLENGNADSKAANSDMPAIYFSIAQNAQKAQLTEHDVDVINKLIASMIEEHNGEN